MQCKTLIIMKNVVLICLGLLVLAGCVQNEINLYDPEAVYQRDVNQNASKYIPTIDPGQDWSSVVSGEVTVTADAPLFDVAKVMLLNGSPVMNSDVQVLAEAEAQKGQTVKLKYDAPNDCDMLIAVCVDKAGHSYMKAFHVGATSVSFATAKTRTRAVTRADDASFPALQHLKIETKNSELSYNALRTQFVNEAYATGDATMLDVVQKGNISQWHNAGWENDRLWKPTDKYNTGTEWEIRNQTVLRAIPDITAEEKATLWELFGDFLQRTDDKAPWKRKDNRDMIRNSDAVKLYSNHLLSDGTTPITITPIFMASGEIGNCHLYFYYYNPADIPAGVSEEQYIKDLPKFKAIQCWHTRSAANSKGYGREDLFKIHEYLLPYYGEPSAVHALESAPGTLQAQALAIPRGYRIGFALRKLKDTGPFVDGYRNITDAGHGCCYSFGGLNREINNLPGHFGSSMTVFTMDDEDPRTCYFTANGKTYIGFEDGSDCQYNDMVIEVGGYDQAVLTEAPVGTEDKGCGIDMDFLYDMAEIDGQSYTLCFEDRPLTADYDMNDVVLRCKRVGTTSKYKNWVQLSLVAAGGVDDVVLHVGRKAVRGDELDGKEVHELFFVDEEKGDARFVNTVVGRTIVDPITGYYELDEGMTIPQFLSQIYIENVTSGEMIGVAATGMAPMGIIVPYDFDYPMEQKSIVHAYTAFKEWASHASQYPAWFRYESDGMCYPVKDVIEKIK